GDATALPFPDGSFDLVVDCMTSQHLPWRAHKFAFMEYRRVLRPSGQVFLYHLDARTDCNMAQINGWDITGLALFPTAPLTCLPQSSTLALVLEQSGFGAIER